MHGALMTEMSLQVTMPVAASAAFGLFLAVPTQ
jgi:hypothetical protein